MRKLVPFFLVAAFLLLNVAHAEDSHGSDGYPLHPVINDSEQQEFTIAGPEDQDTVDRVVKDFTQYQQERHGLQFVFRPGDDYQSPGQI